MLFRALKSNLTFAHVLEPITDPLPPVEDDDIHGTTSADTRSSLARAVMSLTPVKATTSSMAKEEMIISTAATVMISSTVGTAMIRSSVMALAQTASTAVPVATPSTIPSQLLELR
jgi:hypothetical protein